MATKINQGIQKEINKLGVPKNFFTYNGEQYVSKKFEGEYGKTYFVLYKELYEYDDKDKDDCIGKCEEEFLSQFKGETFLSVKKSKFIGRAIKLHLNGKIFIVEMSVDNYPQCPCLSVKTVETGQEKWFDTLVELVGYLREQAGLENVKFDSQFDKYYKRWSVRKQWRCDIMIPDDPWGNTCTTKYGDTFTDAFTHARECRAGLGWI